MATRRKAQTRSGGDDTPGVTSSEERTDAIEPEVLDADGEPITGEDEQLEDEQLAGEDLEDEQLAGEDLEDEQLEDEQLEDEQLEGDDLGGLAEPELEDYREQIHRTDEGMDGAARYLKAQAELDAVIESINSQMMHRPRKGRRPKYRLRIFRRWPEDVSCYCPALEVDLRNGIELEEIGELYGGGVYDIQLMEGRKKVPAMAWHGIPFAGDPILIPGAGRSPNQAGQVLTYGARQPRVFQPYDQGQQGAGGDPRLGDALERIVEGFREAQEVTADAVARLEERIEAAKRDPTEEFTKSIQNLMLMKQGIETMFPQPAPQIPTGESAAVWATLINHGIEKLPQIIQGLQAFANANDNKGQSVPQRPDGLRPIRVLDDESDSDAGD